MSKVYFGSNIKANNNSLTGDTFKGNFKNLLLPREKTALFCRFFTTLFSNYTFLPYHLNY